jgi:hypothetical protein
MNGIWGHNTIYFFYPVSFLGLPGLPRITFFPVMFDSSVRDSQDKGDKLHFLSRRKVACPLELPLFFPTSVTS